MFFQVYGFLKISILMISVQVIKTRKPVFLLKLYTKED